MSYTRNKVKLDKALKYIDVLCFIVSTSYIAIRLQFPKKLSYIDAVGFCIFTIDLIFEFFAFHNKWKCDKRTKTLKCLFFIIIVITSFIIAHNT